MGERGAMWWTVPPSVPCPDKDLVQWVLNLQKQPLRERGITKDVWFQVFDIDIKALITLCHYQIQSKNVTVIEYGVECTKVIKYIFSFSSHYLTISSL